MAKTASEKLDIISDYCENIFFRSLGSDVLLVFLPSVNGKNVYPYFPRKSWAEELVKKYNVLYVSDPYQPLPQYKEPMGSWFISPDGNLTLKSLAKLIVQAKEEIGSREVVFYGSSMGGYAAIILASLVEGSKAIAECPQIYLKNHPGSRYVCEYLLDPKTLVIDVEPLKFIKQGKAKHLQIVCSIFDRHYQQHVLPFVNDIKSFILDSETTLTLAAYGNFEYKKGHVALNKKDAIRIIESVLDGSSY